MHNNSATQPTANETFWHRGDQAVYTGESQLLHGAVFYTARWLEGHRAGTTFVTQRAPKAGRC